MIKRQYATIETTDAYYFVREYLSSNRDYYFTKEEIYRAVPTDNYDLPLITISSVENALRQMARCGDIDACYVRGIRHYGCRDRQN